jgi:hypothetical protein
LLLLMKIDADDDGVESVIATMGRARIQNWNVE